MGHVMGQMEYVHYRLCNLHSQYKHNDLKGTKFSALAINIDVFVMNNSAVCRHDGIDR